MKNTDAKRARHAKKQALQATHQARIRHRRDRKDKNEEAKRKDGVEYAAGSF